MYCVVAVVIETHAVKEARKTIDGFRMPRQRRVHMVKERPARHQQDRDRMAIASELRALGNADAIAYDHYAPHTEPMLWAADGLAWTVLARRTTPTSLVEVP